MRKLASYFIRVLVFIPILFVSFLNCSIGSQLLSHKAFYYAYWTAYCCNDSGT